jgi:hypothetical protein
MVLFGKKQVYKSKWLWGYLLVLTISIVDWLVSVTLGCNEVKLRITIFIGVHVFSRYSPTHVKISQLKVKFYRLPPSPLSPRLKELQDDNKLLEQLVTSLLSSTTL